MMDWAQWLLLSKHIMENYLFCKWDHNYEYHTQSQFTNHSIHEYESY